MLGSTLTRLRVLLVAQALATGGLAVAGPFDAGRWLPFVAGVAAGAVVLAWFVGTRTRSAWTMTLGFEVLALVVGGTGAAAGDYVPGTALAIGVLAQLVLPAGRAGFATAVPSAAAPVRLTPPPVVAAPSATPVPAPPTAPPAFPPPGLLVSAAGSGNLPPVLPPPTVPPPMPPVARNFSATILPGR